MASFLDRASVLYMLWAPDSSGTSDSLRANIAYAIATRAPLPRDPNEEREACLNILRERCPELATRWLHEHCRKHALDPDRNPLRTFWLPCGHAIEDPNEPGLHSLQCGVDVPPHVYAVTCPLDVYSDTARSPRNNDVEEFAKQYQAKIVEALYPLAPGAVTAVAPILTELSGYQPPREGLRDIRLAYDAQLCRRQVTAILAGDTLTLRVVTRLRAVIDEIPYSEKELQSIDSRVHKPRAALLRNIRKRALDEAYRGSDVAGTLAHACTTLAEAPAVATTGAGEYLVCMATMHRIAAVIPCKEAILSLMYIPTQKPLWPVIVHPRHSGLDSGGEASIREGGTDYAIVSIPGDPFYRTRASFYRIRRTDHTEEFRAAASEYRAACAVRRWGVKRFEWERELRHASYWDTAFRVNCAPSVLIRRISLICTHIRSACTAVAAALDDRDINGATAILQSCTATLGVLYRESLLDCHAENYSRGGCRGRGGGDSGPDQLEDLRSLAECTAVGVHYRERDQLELKEFVGAAVRTATGGIEGD